MLTHPQKLRVLLLTSRVVKNSKLKVSFVIGKNWLAPFKEKCLSILKLGSEAAVTGTWIKTKLLEEMIYFRSNSKTILKYIYNKKKNFPVYVMHRLGNINSDITDWNCIPTYHNVSDACIWPIDFSDFKD